MKNFTVRVFLFGEDSAGYKTLDDIMVNHGFSVKIASDTGRVYRLPVGEYNFVGDLDRKLLLEKVQASAGQIGGKYSVLITESRGRIWFNLDIDGD